LIVAYTQNS